MNVRVAATILFVSALVPFAAYADATTTPATTTPDVTAPTILAPVDQSFTATTTPASPVLVAAGATDDTDPAPIITYAPQTFSFGTTTVVWTATDASGNAATTSSQVGVFLNINGTVDVPALCDVSDTDGVVHSYVASSSDPYVAICALQAALENGAVTSAGFSNQYPSLGLYITSINGLVADPNSQYWALYQNDTFASCGLGCLPVAAGDTLMLQLHDFSDTNLGHQLTIHVQSLVGTTTSGTSSSTPPAAPAPASGGGGGIVHFQIDRSSALSFLVAQQHADGSFGSSLYTDWAALAFAASDPGSAKINLRNYLLSASPTLTSITDYERHAMALMALGIDPYTGTSKDYITPIVKAFDGTQVGDVSLDNDDIFAIFPLLHAGYGANDMIIQKTATFILSRQKPNGSWDESPDMTAAAIQALGPLYTIPGLNAALGKAAGYLLATQRAEGGWGSVDSTSWVQTAINGIIEAHTPDFETESAWTSTSGYYPTDALRVAQQPDGGMLSPTDRVWSTAYAVVAASGKSWLTILQTFVKPSASVSTGSGSGGGGITATTTNATSTASTTTSSPPVSTSTPQVLGASTSTTEIAATESTSMAPAAKPVLKKKVTVLKPVPIVVEPPTISTPAVNIKTQTAGAAAGSGGFLGKVWQAVTSFFSWLF